MREQFYIPGVWDPSRSLLGMAIRRLEQDRLRSSATFYVVAIAVVTGYLLTVFLGWAWLHRAGTPSTEAAQNYWVIQAFGMGLVTTLSWAGWRRGVLVTISDSMLVVARGRQEMLSLPIAKITGLSRIPAIQVQQHYSRYAQTRTFVGPAVATTVLLETEAFPLILGLREAEQPIFLSRLGELLPAAKGEATRVA